MSGYTRNFLSIEQALKVAISDLRAKKTDFEKEIGRSEKYLRKCSDENEEDSNLDLKDAIQIDKTILDKSSGAPMYNVYQAQINNHIAHLHQKRNHQDIQNILLDIQQACSELINIVRESKKPTSDMGEKISNKEKESIYTAIKDIEEQISGIKIHIGPE
jgi:hypothetical protein